jgi:hypothetical protein
VGCAPEFHLVVVVRSREGTPKTIASFALPFDDLVELSQQRSKLERFYEMVGLIVDFCTVGEPR